MAELQVCDILPHYHEMKASVSMSGITFLKETRYKSRHSTVPDVTQIPRKGFVYKKSIPPLPNKRKASHKSKKEQQIDNSIRIPKEKVTRYYTIDKKIVTHRIKQMINQMKGTKQLYFWTITFPEGTNDDTAFLLFNKWMTRLRTTQMLKSYLWVSERQLNGTLHFHMAINHKMDVKRANRYMRASIFTCIEQGLIPYTKQQALNYNGVDISKNRKTRRVTNFAKENKEKALTSYLTKYISKNNETFSHLAWHNSRDYSNLIISVRATAAEIRKSNLLHYTDQSKPLTGEYYTFYKWTGKPPDKVLSYFRMVNNKIQDIISTFIHSL